MLGMVVGLKFGAAVIGALGSCGAVGPWVAPPGPQAATTPATTNDSAAIRLFTTGTPSDLGYGDVAGDAAGEAAGDVAGEAPAEAAGDVAADAAGDAPADAPADGAAVPPGSGAPGDPSSDDGTTDGAGVANVHPGLSAGAQANATRPARHNKVGATTFFTVR